MKIKIGIYTYTLSVSKEVVLTKGMIDRYCIKHYGYLGRVNRVKAMRILTNCEMSISECADWLKQNNMWE